MTPAIVVTGAASGIGRELARQAARDGAFMLLVDRSHDPLESFAAELASSGTQAHALSIDLLTPNAGEVIENALKERGLYCDVLVNNAGVGLVGLAIEIDRSEQMRLVDINLRALTELTLRFLSGMVARGRGGVINVSSIVSYAAGPNMAVYNATKTYVRSFSSALASEVAGSGVSITCLCPGMVRTQFYDQLSIKRTRLFKIMPRSNASETAKAAWRGFRAGKRLVIPRLINRIIAAILVVLPGRAILRLSAGTIQQPAPGTLPLVARSEAKLKPAIVVTGASSGIGRELARIAAPDYSCMMLVARSQDALAKLAEELTSGGTSAHTLPIDLANSDAGDTIENALKERGLYCDVIVNNAGICLAGPAAELGRSEQMQLVDVNIRALTELTLRFLPGMVARGRGGVLNLGSIGSYMSAPNMAVYHASKAYVQSF
jgi:short-subunit dehydrogenase